MPSDPTVVFRVDASTDMGNGHAMRCLALADELRTRGAQCCFVSRPHRGNLVSMIDARGFAVRVLRAPAPARRPLPGHQDWLGADWYDDARETCAMLGTRRIDWLVVDHYAIDSRWEQRVRAQARRLLVIDDLADRPHDCDILLDQNLGATPQDYAPWIAPGCVTLIGPRHALLRPQFARRRAQSLLRRKVPQLHRLLITMGGVDKDNATSLVLDALGACALPETMRISVVMGPHAPWIDAVRDRASRMHVPTEVLTGVEDMADLMSRADLAIGAAGATSWERCVLGLPSIVVAVAQNQHAIARALDSAGAAIASGIDELPATLAGIFADPLAPAIDLRSLGVAASSVTDGHGASLVASIMTDFDCHGHHLPL